MWTETFILVNLMKMENGMDLANSFTTRGDVYEGQFKDGFIFGHGTLVCVKAPDSDFAVKYKGEWKNSSQNGFGVLEVEGNVIIKNFQHGLPHGHCVEVGDGYTCEGHYFKGNFQGVGTITWTDGRVYNGSVEARSASWIRCLAFT